MQRTIRRFKTDVSTSSNGSRYSDESQDSQSTSPTQYGSRPSIQHAATDRPVYSKREYDIAPCSTDYARSSTETYASGASEEDLFDEEPDTYDPEYEVPEYRDVVDSESIKPATPQNWAKFFPTTKRLCIRHDDTTEDGNMNLRVDAETRKEGIVQLFHLRMQDLKKREFSLRRYERSSGREVCKSARKYIKPTTERPPLTKSVSNAFSSIRKPDFKRTSSILSQHSHKSSRSRRQDSGYGSDEEFEAEMQNFMSEKKIPVPTNTTKLEFSNYAQVEVKRRGAKSSKRYEFEYWGYHYTWKRVVEKNGNEETISYLLFRGDGERPVAHIIPDLRSPSQVREEEMNGGWIPPHSMWITDKSLLEAITDVCE